MSPIGPIGPVLSNILVQIPVYLAWIVGLILAVVTWRKHPRASLLTLIGLGMFFVQAVLGNVLSPWLQRAMMRRDVPIRTMQLVLVGRGLITSLVMMIAWTLLLGAIFLPRRSGSSPPP
jgi:heme A synthase